MNIEDLKKSISEMSDKELEDIVLNSRNNRMRIIQQSKGVTKKAAKALDLTSMSPEQAAALLDLLTGESDET